MVTEEVTLVLDSGWISRLENAFSLMLGPCLLWELLSGDTDTDRDKSGASGNDGMLLLPFPNPSIFRLARDRLFALEWILLS
jgi:hypothetical protein